MVWENVQTMQTNMGFNKWKTSLSHLTAEPLKYPPFPVWLSLFMLAFTLQTSTFPYSLKSQTKAYLCKVLGNLPWSVQHIGACLTFTRAPQLSNSSLQHLWPLRSPPASPSTCQRQPPTDCQHFQTCSRHTAFDVSMQCVRNGLHWPSHCFSDVFWSLLTGLYLKLWCQSIKMCYHNDNVWLTWHITY